MDTCLDWSAAEHWSRQSRPCRLCGAPTNLRDGAGRPAHKFCVERAVDQLRRRRLKIVPEAS